MNKFLAPPMKKVTAYSYLLDLYLDPKTGTLKESYRPMISIKISDDKGNTSFSFDALVDSGSDRNLFPLSMAEDTGLTINKKNVQKILGVGGSIIAYSSKIFVWVGGQKYETEADFSSQQIPLLGRSGFFNLFKSIKFDENKKFFYIKEK